MQAVLYCCWMLKHASLASRPLRDVKKGAHASLILPGTQERANLNVCQAGGSRRLQSQSYKGMEWRKCISDLEKAFSKTSLFFRLSDSQEVFLKSLRLLPGPLFFCRVLGVFASVSSQMLENSDLTSIEPTCGFV